MPASADTPDSPGTSQPAARPPALPPTSTEATDAAVILVPRRRPAQARSRARFNRILKAARDVLVAEGFESFTFDEVAKRAEVPIGTLYQFFANKYVLICELDRQDTADTVAALRAFSEQVPTPQWPDVLESFIDHLAELWFGDPSRRAVWHAVQSTPATRTTAAATEKQVTDLIATVLAPLSPRMTPAERDGLAGILLHTASSLLNFGVRDAGTQRAEFARIVTELKRMLLAYLFAVAGA